MNLHHLLNPSACMKHLRITGEADIECDVCGRRFGFTYCMDPIRAFVYQKYIKYRPEISYFVRNEAVQPPTVDEWAEFHREFIDELHAGLMSAFDENVIESDEGETDEEWFDDFDELEEEEVSYE